MMKGTLNIIIDQLTPCLIDTISNKEVETIVYKIDNVNVLKGLTKRTNWYANWVKLFKEFEVFALALRDSPSTFQGLVALQDASEASVMLLHWAVAAPHNNPLISQKKYNGVGGHLFAIAVEESAKRGYGGVVIGHPANRELDTHYKEILGAETFPYGLLASGYEFTIAIQCQAAKDILERYSYEYYKNDNE